MLKSSVGGTPVYAMSVFRIPKTVISKISSMMANYWWGDDSNKRKIHWIAWEKVCLPKELGGIGFRELECFNQALLAKQGWKILNKPDSLLARFLKSIYFKEGEFLSAPMGTRPSYAWRSLLHGRELLKKGLRHRVGNGKSTKVWLDKWIDDPEEGLRPPWIKKYSFDVNLTADKLIDSVSGRWEKCRLEEIFVPGDVEIILRNQPVVSKEDYASWKYNKSGQISVKSAYWLAADLKRRKNQPQAFVLPSLNGLKEKVWKSQTSPKLRVFMWKALSEALPVADLIITKGMKVDERCQACGDEGESINHVLFSCHFARQTWASSSIPHPQGGFHPDSIFQNFAYLFSLDKSGIRQRDDSRMWPWILWNLWKRRNDLLFEGRCFTPSDLVLKANRDATEWFLAQAMEKEWIQEEKASRPIVHRNWHPPKPGWKMCNVGVDFDKSKRVAGGAWVVRNERGVVLFHSRRSFAGITTKDEAKFEVLLWAIESMKSH